MHHGKPRLIRTLAIGAATALAVAACGSSGAAGESPTPETEGTQTEFEIVMSEFAFTSDSITLPAGKTISLTLRNEGTIDHEFMLGRTSQEDGGYVEDLFAQLDAEVVSGHGYEMMGFDDHMDEAEDHMEEAEADHHEEGEADHHEEEAVAHAHGSMLTLEPGGQVTLTLHIPADAVGTWELGCFLPGHYDAGKLGTVTITG
jgi:uncharacterized cupredoxin-like copper-binding protein